MSAIPSIKHVFMSYSRSDHVVMERVLRFLRKQGIKVWVDSEVLVPGTPTWRKGIEKAIIGSNAVIVLLSPGANNSIWVERELNFAETHEKRIFPLLIAGDEKSSIAPPVKSFRNSSIVCL